MLPHRCIEASIHAASLKNRQRGLTRCRPACLPACPSTPCCVQLLLPFDDHCRERAEGGFGLLGEAGGPGCVLTRGRLLSEAWGGVGA